MAYQAVHKAVLLTPDEATDVTGGGLGAAEGGTFMLNVNNKSGGTVTIDFIAVVPAGEELAEQHEWDNAIALDPSEGERFHTLMPMKLNSGDKVFVKADAAIPAQLNGEAR